MLVNFTREEMHRIAWWGTARTNENKYRSDIRDYRREAFNLTSEQANRLGVMVEYGIYKWLAPKTGWDLEDPDPSVWAAFVEAKDYEQLNKPDIAGVIEARRANSLSSPIPLRSKDVRDGAFVVQGFVHYMQDETSGHIRVPAQVTLLGWADAVKDYPNGEIPWWSKGDARVVGRRPMDTLDLEVLGVHKGVVRL